MNIKNFLKSLKRFNTLVSLSILCTLSCSADSAEGKYFLEKAFPNLKFNEPLFLTYSPDNSNNIFVVQRGGKILSFSNKSGTKNYNVFLDLSDKVVTNGSEQGLLGLAFHPDFKKNGFFYVNYIASNPERTVIARFHVKQGPTDKSIPVRETEKILMEIEQTYANHNGGMIDFGPDSYLYIGMGDGGSGGDPQGNGQNPKALLGSILRIDVNKGQNGKNYSIPHDNPFYKNKDGFREEIWAKGIRNPWRFSFDKKTGKLWVADVGQNNYEEVNIIEKGKNYGWNIMEGFHCYKTSFCNKENMSLPVIEYEHSKGYSVTGGYVYRGKLLPELQGSYIYGDFGSGNIWELRYDNKVISNKILLNSGLNISSFGIDQNNEIYLLDYMSGVVYKLSNKK